MNAIECEGLSKRFADKVALNQVNLAIPAHRLVGILGENGAGKSTFFRLLVGQLQGYEGNLQVLGKTPSWQQNGQIAYLPDRARWYRDYTVKKTIAYGSRFLPKFQQKTALTLAEQMKLSLAQRVDSMSRGQEAKLMLLLCMSREVPLVILDEPFAGIDMISREQIMETIISLSSERERTILISTHEIAESEALFDYAVFFREGEVALAGDVDELRQTRGSLQNMFRDLFR